MATYATPAPGGVYERPPAAPMKAHATVHRAPTPRGHGYVPAIARNSGGAAPQFDFKKPGLDNLWQRMTNVRSWYSHLTSGLGSIVISLLVFVWLKPAYIMEKSEEGLVSDNISLPKLFVASGVVGLVTVGIGLWMNGVP